ncbi:DUF190 domain-containing protein [soil metagenome]
MAKVTMLRVFITEQEHLLEPIMKHLHNELKVRGVTVMRGIVGFGSSGEVHRSSLLDLSLNLPLVIECFDDTSKSTEILEYLKTMVDSGHIISWEAECH